MVKYFWKDSNKEVKFGDYIDEVWKHEDKDNTSYIHVKGEFNRRCAELLLCKGIIYAKDIPNETKNTKAHSDVETRLKVLEDRIIELEGVVADLLDFMEEDE